MKTTTLGKLTFCAHVNITTYNIYNMTGPCYWHIQTLFTQEVNNYFRKWIKRRQQKINMDCYSEDNAVLMMWCYLIHLSTLPVSLHCYALQPPLLLGHSLRVKLCLHQTCFFKYITLPQFKDIFWHHFCCIQVDGWFKDSYIYTVVTYYYTKDVKYVMIYIMESEWMSLVVINTEHNDHKKPVTEQTQYG